jgi:hypothetical protein
MDPEGTVLADIVGKFPGALTMWTKLTSRVTSPAKCTNKQQIKINYDLTLKLNILSVNIAPKISSTANIDCPVDDLSALTVSRQDRIDLACRLIFLRLQGLIGGGT